MSESRLIKVKIVTPTGGECEFECDSVRMKAQDNAKGTGGGDFGVRYGHADALASLDKGEILAYTAGKLTHKLAVNGGFAKITHDSVTVITEGYSWEQGNEGTVAF